jgi:2,3-bisphosphoglycerate-independent phosphoglycerate mutase
VTFFFSGWRDEPFAGETRLMIDSPQDVFTYDQKPEMSAPEVTDKLIAYIWDHQPDFVCLNYCNPDMVWHTGNLGAVITACETVDVWLGRVVQAWLDLW